MIRKRPFGVFILKKDEGDFKDRKYWLGDVDFNFEDGVEFSGFKGKVKSKKNCFKFLDRVGNFGVGYFDYLTENLDEVFEDDNYLYKVVEGSNFGGLL